MKKWISFWILSICLIFLSVPTCFSNSMDDQKHLRTTSYSINTTLNETTVNKNATAVPYKSTLHPNPTGLNTAEKIACFIVLGVIVVLAFLLLLWRIKNISSSASIIHPQSLYQSGVDKGNLGSLNGISSIKHLQQVNLKLEVENRRDILCSSFNYSESFGSSFEILNEPLRKVSIA